MPRHPQRSTGNGVAFDVTFPARVELLPSQRREFAEWLDALGLGADVRDDLTVVFSELTANAVAGSPDDEARVSARAELDGAHVVIDISNATEGATAQVRRPDLADPLRPGGRGLMIVRALVDDLDVIRDGADLAVRCRCRVLDEPVG